MENIIIRYIFKSKTTGQIWIEKTPIECLEGKGDTPFVLDDYEKGDWFILSRDLFTGLKDKNGKEIYEGDIMSNGHFNAKIVFIEGKFQMRIIWNNSLVDIIYYNGSCEVIGNIYENLELLEAQER